MNLRPLKALTSRTTVIWLISLLSCPGLRSQCVLPEVVPGPIPGPEQPVSAGWENDRLALLAGVILGLRFHIGLVLTATAAVLALDLGLEIGGDPEAATLLADAALYATVVQVAALLVHVVKDSLKDGAGAFA